MFIHTMNKLGLSKVHLKVFIEPCYKVCSDQYKFHLPGKHIQGLKLP